MILPLTPVSAETLSGNLRERLYQGSVEYDGVMYLPIKRLTTVLVMGIDRNEKDIPADSLYRSGGQADFLCLLVFDDSSGKVTPIQINRDTMASMAVLNVNGERTGSSFGQICLAFSYGDGRENSCLLEAECIGKLMGDIGVDHYIAMGMDGISAMNDALGGITVTLDDDFSMYDPAMTKGTTLRLEGNQSEYYLRYRYYVGDGSNESRLKRQRKYIEQAASVVRDMVQSNANSVNVLLDAVGPYLITDMSRGMLMNYATAAKRCEIIPLVEISGDSKAGASGFSEFYPNQGELQRIILDTFYYPAD